MRGRKRSFCAMVPYFISTGAIIDRPNGIWRGAPAVKHSSSKMLRCTAFQPQPPCSVGQPGARGQDALPAHVVLALDAQEAEHLAANVVGQVRGDELAHFAAEALLFGG